jgi:hypothetical protein
MKGRIAARGRHVPNPKMSHPTPEVPRYGKADMQSDTCGGCNLSHMALLR